MEYRTQKILLTGKIDDEMEDYFLWQCHHSNSLYNCTLWEIRQSHFATCPTYQYFDQDDCYKSAYKDGLVKASYADLCKHLKDNKHYVALGGQQAQQTIGSAVEGIKSYNKLIRLWWSGELDNKPRIPYYRTSGGLYQVSFPSQAVTYDDVSGQCRLATSQENKPELFNSVLTINSGTEFKSEQLSEVRIVPSNRKLWAEYVYQVETKKAIGLDYSHGIGLDPGVENWIGATSSRGKSFIVCGRKIKSVNQRYNKAVALHKKGKSQNYWDDYLADLTHKRNAFMRDAVNKCARLIINYCLHHRIGNIVFGWGQGVKNKSNLGKKNNQNFVPIPTSRLKNRIQELAESVGIIFTETEEAYTSKSDYFSSDLLPKFGEKPAGYKFSGRRITRGTYRTAQGWLICADCLGGLNILKKVAIQLGIKLAEVGREILTVPKRYTLSCLKKVYRKRCEVVAFSPA